MNVDFSYFPVIVFRSLLQFMHLVVDCTVSINSDDLCVVCFSVVRTVVISFCLHTGCTSHEYNIISTMLFKKIMVFLLFSMCSFYFFSFVEYFTFEFDFFHLYLFLSADFVAKLILVLGNENDFNEWESFKL